MLGWGFSIVFGGDLTSINVSPGNNEAGEQTIYTFGFTTSATGNGTDVGIPADGKIIITFPAGFDLTQAEISQTTNSATMDGGLITATLGNIITLERDNTGSAVAGSAIVGLKVAMISNHQTAASNYTVDVETQLNDGTLIDSGTSSSFSVIHNALAYFQFDNISLQTAGTSFGITITAMDEYDNTVTTFSSTATLSDLTATISPTTTTNFISGVWTGNVQITESRNNNTISVSAQNKTGVSNQFDVEPGAVSHFVFSAIPSPQIAGNAISITIVAEDIYNNQVTDFTDIVALSDSTGTISPSTTGSFSGGQWTGNVTINKKQSDVAIIASYGSVVSQSNLFNIKANDVDRFSISTITSQTAGTPFIIEVTALDAYNNQVDDFDDAVDISDLSGSISPTISQQFSSGYWSGNVTINQMYTNNVITVVRTSTGTESGSSNGFNVSHNSLDRFSFSTITSPQRAGTFFSITITALDAFGNTVTSYNGTSSLSDLTGTINPAVTGNFVDGVWTGNVEITQIQSSNRVMVSSGTKSGTSNNFDVVPADIHHFTIQNISSPQTAGQDFSITITAEDIYNNTVTNFTNSVNLSDATGTISPSSTTNFSFGQWTGNVQISKSQKNVTIIASRNAVTGESNTFNVDHAPLDRFSINNIGTQAAGEPFAITVTAKDFYNNRVTNFDGTVDITDISGSITPSTSGIFELGQWSGDVVITTVMTNNRITVTKSGGTQTGSSNQFDIVAGDIDHFEITAIPGLQTAGEPFSVTVTAKDANDATVTTFNGTVNVNDETGTVSPSVTTNFNNGVWTGNLTITKSLTNNNITVVGVGKSGYSNDFDVQAASANYFEFDTITSPKTAGTAFSVVIMARDEFGNVATSFANTADLSDDTGTLTPDETGVFNNGQWNGNVTITKAQNDIELQAEYNTVSGMSNKFNVQATTLDHFAIDNISTQLANEPFTIVITAQDVYDNKAIQYAGMVDLSDLTGTITPSESGSFSNGIWSGNVTISQSRSDDIVTVTNQGGTESGSSNAFDVTSGNLDHFSISTISDQTAGQSFIVSIQAEDIANNLVSSFSGTVSISDLTGTVNPTISGNFTNGQWTGSLTINKSRSNNTITVTGSGKAGTSSSFDVSSAALDYFDISTITSPQVAGNQISLTVTARDVFGNRVTTYTDQVSISDNTGSISPTQSTNFINGSWIGNVTITSSLTDNVININGGGKSGVSNKFNVIAAPLDHFIFGSISTQAAGEAFSITITAQDEYGNIATHYSGKVDLSDDTGTINPDESGSFSNGRWIGNVVITQSFSNNKITAVNQGGIESGTSESFDVISSDVDHFVISSINDQIAGQPFNITVRAEDSSNNLVTNFTGNAALSDLTGTVQPKTTGNFINGEWTGSVTITQSLSQNSITVTSSGKAGSSNNFSVLPNQLDHFSISTINSPQIAGQQFAITITAKDLYDNTVTGFTEVVNISDNTNTILPTVSASFSNGSWSGNLTVTLSVTDNVVFVEGSGKNGTSNGFNVIAAGLDHFNFGTISTQAAGEPFTINVTAKDEFDNTATQFVGKVNIADETSTISPTESGNFYNGNWSGNVVISQASNDNVINVVNKNGTETGSSNNFDVISSDVDHFTFSTVSDQQAGNSFSVTIYARDRENNLVTDFSGTATLSDLTGTITPTTTGNFSSGVWSGTVNIIKSRGDNIITVTSSGKAGNTNNFDVLPAALDHFKFENISSPKIAGTSFQIIMYAEDIYNNRVTSFNDFVSLNDETGTITPTATTNFSNGSWSGNVMITKSQSDVTISAQKDGKTGQSNIFNVNPCSLQRFEISNISTQAAGYPFSITVTAIDGHSNVATQFSGTVDITDLTGTVSPTITTNFDNGKWTGNVRITQVGQDNIITVTNTGGTQTGQSAPFDVISSSVDHFEISTISSPQIAGNSFSIVVTALDADNNTVTNFTGTANLSDLTGTISPSVTGNFQNGVWSGNVTITQYSTDNKITVISSGKAGVSNSFTVIHNTLDHFVFETIGSPQVAGAAFSITIIASDVFDNTVLDYNNQAILHDNTGTLTPTTTGNFTDGVWSGSVQITKTQADVQIFVDDNGKIGSSNKFNIESAALYHFDIDSIETQAAGELFQMSITAQDFYDNRVATFTGTVDIDDYTGTITPDQSGNFVNGKWTGNVKITTVRTNNRVSVTRTGGSETGESNLFDVISSSVDHFEFTSISSPQTAGQEFLVAISAMDKEDNIVSTFAEAISLNDLTGTITPKTTTNFVDGVWTGNVKITQAITNNKIIATGLGKASESNMFNVIHGALDHFVINNILSPQTAGEPFNVTITANDSMENIVTDYGFNANLSDNTGTIAPQTVTGFIDGVWSGQVTITKKQNDVFITASRLGSTGRSNYFNVKAGALFSLKVMDNAGGLGNEVESVAMTLDDQLKLFAAGFDEYGNYSRDVVVQWGVTGNLDQPNPLVGIDTNFDPDTPGTSGKIYADSTGLVADSTGTISVGEIAYVKIRTAANGSGTEVFDLTVTADDELRLYCAGYDAGNNYIGDVSVQWLSTSSLTPAIDTTAVSIVFEPTLAPANGYIVANHATAMDDTTGLISVNPGVPVGNIALSPNPAVLPADGVSVSLIQSGPVYDADGNFIASGTQFTVTTTAGTITSTDVNPTLPKKQIAAGDSGIIRFTLQAPNTGGTAFISVSSVNGSADGDTSVFFTQLNITAISSPKLKVSQGQQDAIVYLDVQNMGTNTVTNLSAGLLFTGPAPNYENRSSDFQGIVRNDNITTIPSGTTRRLSFLVDVTENALTDTVTIDGWISGQIGGVSVTDTFSLSKWKWVVQTPANLRILKVYSVLDEVSQGRTGINVSMNVINQGQATANVVLDTLYFYSIVQADDVTNEYDIMPAPANPTFIQGNGGPSQFNFTVNVKPTATLGEITIDGKISAFDANSDQQIMDDTADTTHAWFVRSAPVVGIKGFYPSQLLVTKNQTVPWDLTMVVENNGYTTVELDSTNIIFLFKGADVSSEYAVVKPTAFIKSENKVLAGNSSDTLRFSVNETGTDVGEITIRGVLYLKDTSTMNPIVVESLTGVRVQDPGQLKILAVKTSQSSVTQNQGQDWKVHVTIENQGGTELRIDTLSAQTNISFSSGTDFIVRNPVELSGGGLILSTGSIDTLTFTVDSTGSAAGISYINIKVTGYQTTSGDIVEIQQDSAASVLVEEPAKIRIFSVNNNAANAPYVNRAQNFPIRVVLENVGGDQAKIVSFEMQSSGGSIPEVMSSSLTNISGGGGKKEHVFYVTADSNQIQAETFSVNVTGALAQNTSEAFGAQQVPAVDSTETVIIQDPASFFIANIIAPDTVSASQITPWRIRAAVSNNGGANAIIESPSQEDIQIMVNGNVESDYIIVPPAELTGGGLSLIGGTTDTLIYTVSTTGEDAGEAVIQVRLNARDQNDQQILSGEDNRPLYVQSTAAVQLNNTTPICFNYSGEKGLVNSGQPFVVRVAVQNLGRKQVVDVKVQLTTDGGSLIQQDTLTIESIEYREIKNAEFQVIADPNSVVNEEVFTSRIMSAFEYDSGLPADIDNSLGNKARIAVQDSAKLKISANTVSGYANYTTNQVFTIETIVDNLGTASVDNSGTMGLFVPGDYKIVSNQDTLIGNQVISFVPGQNYQWQILTPGYESLSDSIRISILNAPKDLNLDNQAALLLQQHDTLVVNTLATTMYYSTSVTQPIGAQDRIISTYQDFTVDADIQFSNNVKNVKAVLRLPKGEPVYQFVSAADSLLFLETPGMLRWGIRAPVRADDDFRKIKVLISGEAPERFVFEDTVEVKTVNRANLTLDAFISYPVGAQDSVVSVGQEFEIKAQVKNIGTADVYGDGFIKINFGSTGCEFADTSETLVKPFKLDSAIVWHLRAPSIPTSKANLFVNYFENKIPKDENTNQIAWIEQGNEQSKVPLTTIFGGSINMTADINSPDGAKDSVISTYQEFNIFAQINSNGVENLESELIYSGDFSFAPNVNPIQPGESSAQWRLVAPPDSISNTVIKIITRGNDVNDIGTMIYSDTVRIVVDVVKRADTKVIAEIVSPHEATDGVVSVQQEFVVQAYLLNYGQANYTGAFNLEITLPEDYETNDDLLKTAYGTESIQWRIKAPSFMKDAATIEIRVPPDGGPRDENSGQEVHFFEENRANYITIETNQKYVQLSKIQGRTTNTVVKGQQNVPILGLRVLNPKEDRYTNNIILSGFEVTVKDHKGNPIENPAQVISQIKATKFNQPEIVYGTVSEFTTGSNVTIQFEDSLVVVPDAADTLEVIISISQEPQISSLMISIENDTNVFVHEDLTRNVPIIQTDTPGSCLSLQSEFVVIVGDNLKESFGNYPNPFGSPDKPTTTITYYLKEDCDVDIRIYTLVGELVWSRSFSASDPEGRKGTHDGDVVWDGKNDRGHKVLNGIYVIYFKSGNGESATTKVAILK